MHLGTEVLIEFFDCDKTILADVRRVEKIMLEAARATKSSIVDVIFHTFNPLGVSGVVVIKESHLAIHTWPEHGYACVDIFTCGKNTQPWRAYRPLKKLLKAKRASAMEIKRGLMVLNGKTK